MATPADRLIQYQNLDIVCDGSTAAGKSDVAKADEKGGLARGKAPNDVSNSGNPSVLPSRKRKTSTEVISIKEDLHAVKAKSSKAFKKGKVGGPKALNDLANSVKPRSKLVPSTGGKLNAVVEENVPCDHADSIYDWGIYEHNHEECIKDEEEEIERECLFETLKLTYGEPWRQTPLGRAIELFFSKP